MLRVIQTAIRELRYAFRLFAPHAAVRKVTMFGSGTHTARQIGIPASRELCPAHRRRGLDGYHRRRDPGLCKPDMKEPGRKIASGRQHRLPWEQSANPVIQNDRKLVTFKYFFTRKLTFVRHSDALVLFPGGFGTLDEGYEALTLMQTGKSRIMPCC